MFEMQRICFLILRLLFLLDGGVWSLRNLSISVPRGVAAGSSAALRCSYELEGAPLYSTRWYRGETEFYRYVPRELPPAMVFPLPGASVDLSASDSEVVVLVGLHRRLSGMYSCEVSADAPLFHTDIRTAPLTVVDPPFRAPMLWAGRAQYSRGAPLRVNCSVDAAYPPANLTWTVDGHTIAEHLSPWPAEGDFSERGASSELEITFLDPQQLAAAQIHDEHRMSGTERAMHDYYVYGAENNQKTGSPEVLRAVWAAPEMGVARLGCTSGQLEVTRRTTELLLREDTPRPASVTTDTNGSWRSMTVCVTSLSALLSLSLLL